MQQIMGLTQGVGPGVASLEVAAMEKKLLYGISVGWPGKADKDGVSKEEQRLVKPGKAD